MNERVTLIHDGRPPAFLNAVVLARLIIRRGGILTVFRIRRTKEFWNTTVQELNVEKGVRVVLCCVTFDSDSPERCRNALKNIVEKTGVPPLIITNRWPDGYVQLPYEVLVPPFELLEKYAEELDSEDRQLLALALVMSHQADAVSPAVVDRAERLAAEIISDQEGVVWKQFVTDDPPRALSDIGPKSTAPRNPLCEGHELHTSNEFCRIWKLGAIAKGQQERTIHALIRAQDPRGIRDQPADLPRKLMIGILNEDPVRVSIVRPPGPTLPSVEFLLDRYAKETGLPDAIQWRGSESADSRSLAYDTVHIPPAEFNKLVECLRNFAEKAYKHGLYGENRPAPAIAKLIHKSAVAALKDLDILNVYTQDNLPELGFDPHHVRLLTEESKRQTGVRETLLLPLLIESSKAAGFLFGHGGYNFMKLERLLEGVLLGLAQGRSMWLGARGVPRRLRIDTKFSPNIVDGLGETFADPLKVVESIKLSQAVEQELINENSLLAKALRGEHGGDGEECRLIVFHGSETIGPSLPYASVVSAVAKHLEIPIRESRRGELVILDLFSGSGLSARMLHRRIPAARVYCVDMGISVRDVNLLDMNNVEWFMADCRRFVGGRAKILDRKFDLVCMDPPHGALFEVLFGKDPTVGENLMEAVKVSAPWLVVYQGHTSQSGRGEALQKTLSSYYQRSATVELDAEIILIAGPHEKDTVTFDALVKGVRQVIALH